MLMNIMAAGWVLDVLAMNATVGLLVVAFFVIIFVVTLFVKNI